MRSTPRPAVQKRNRLRALWIHEPTYLVGKLLDDLLEYCRPAAGDSDRDRLFEECERIARRLQQSAPVEALQAITAEGSERGFEGLAPAVRDSIEKNKRRQVLNGCTPSSRS